MYQSTSMYLTYVSHIGFCKITVLNLLYNNVRTSFMLGKVFVKIHNSNSDFRKYSSDQFYYLIAKF